MPNGGWAAKRLTGPGDIDDAATRSSALALARAIRLRERTSREIVEAHIELLVRSQASVNSIAVPRFDLARAEADAADARISNARRGEELPPLLGVPCTIKEIINVKGLAHTTGLLARRGRLAKTTATAAARLLDSGAILLGQTNTSELALSFETENRVYGRTNNPYNPTRTAGGSSGGCAAAVGCGGSPISLGTDTGGSLRMPAFCCGVFAHKPSVGLVPHTLEFPQFSGHTKRMVTVGPITRCAEDLMAVLRILAGPDKVDPIVRPITLGDPASIPIRGLRVLVTQDAGPRRTSHELRRARDRAASALAAAGARVEHIRLPDMRRMLLPTLATLSNGGTATVETLLNDAGAEPIAIRDALRLGGPHTSPLKLLSLADHVYRRIPRKRLEQAITRGQQFAAELAATIGDGVLLHPPLSRTTPPHHHTYGRIAAFQPLSIFNLAGLPVTQMPLGLGRHGLPLGVQVAAGPERDHVSIAVAIELERSLGGWVPPEPT